MRGRGLQATHVGAARGEGAVCRAYDDDRDARPAARAMAEAFAEDPLLWAYLGKKPTEGLFRWVQWVSSESYPGLSSVVADEKRERVLSAALWEEPNLTMGAALRYLATFAYVFWTTGLVRGFRMAQGFLEMESKRLKHAPTALHLMFCGTVASAQGKGLGSVVVRRVLDVSDARGVACYLESSNPRNLPFYKRLGFEVVEEIYPCERWSDKGRGPVCTLMLRPAKAVVR